MHYFLLLIHITSSYLAIYSSYLFFFGKLKFKNEEIIGISRIIGFVGLIVLYLLSFLSIKYFLFFQYPMCSF